MLDKSSGTCYYKDVAKRHDIDFFTLISKYAKPRTIFSPGVLYLSFFIYAAFLRVTMLKILTIAVLRQRFTASSTSELRPVMPKMRYKIVLPKPALSAQP